MARQPRQKTLYATYLISQSCDCDNVFTCTGDEKAFEKALLSAQKHYGFLLIAASIDPCGYHLMVFDNGNDISKIMRSINIAYAMAIDRETFKFKRRFKSVILDNYQAMITALKNFTPLWIEIADKLSASNQRINAKRFIETDLNDSTLKALIGHRKTLLPCTSSACYKKYSQGDTRLATVTECEAHIQQVLQKCPVSKEGLKYNKAMRDTLILDIRRRSNLTLAEIGQLFNGMSASAISKIIKHYNQSL